MILGLLAAAAAAAGVIGGWSRKKKQAPLREIDANTWRESSGYQNELMRQLQQQGSGAGPSYADIQMRRGMEDARAQASSMAASARGGNIALAQRSAAQQAGATQSDIAGAAQLARIEEIDRARGALSQLSTNVRGQDYAVAQTNLAQQNMVDAAEQARLAANRKMLYDTFMTGSATLGNAAMQGYGSTQAQAQPGYGQAVTAQGGYSPSAGGTSPVLLGGSGQSYNSYNMQPTQSSTSPFPNWRR